MKTILIASIYIFIHFKYCYNQTVAEIPYITNCKGFRMDGHFNTSSSIVFLNIQGVRSNLTATARRKEIVLGTSLNSEDRLRLARTEAVLFNILVTFPEKGKNVWQIRYPDVQAQLITFEQYSKKVRIWVTIYNCVAMEKISKCGCS